MLKTKLAQHIAEYLGTVSLPDDGCQCDSDVAQPFIGHNSNLPHTCLTESIARNSQLVAGLGPPGNMRSWTVLSTSVWTKHWQASPTSYLPPGVNISSCDVTPAGRAGRGWRVRATQKMSCCAGLVRRIYNISVYFYLLA